MRKCWLLISAHTQEYTHHRDHTNNIHTPHTHTLTIHTYMHTTHTHIHKHHIHTLHIHMQTLSHTHTHKHTPHILHTHHILNTLHTHSHTHYAHIHIHSQREWVSIILSMLNNMVGLISLSWWKEIWLFLVWEKTLEKLEFFFLSFLQDIRSGWWGSHVLFCNFTSYKKHWLNQLLPQQCMHAHTQAHTCGGWCGCVSGNL